MSIVEQVKATLEQMANRASVPMDLWNEHSNAVLGAVAHIAALEARAKEAEYELRRWKEVESNRPTWEKLWESESNRADEAEAREAELRSALEKIADEQKVYLGHGDYTIEPAYSAEEAQGMARQALAAAPAAPEKPSGESGWLPADPPAEWLEAMVGGIQDGLFGLLGVDIIGDEEAADVARAAYAALARKMGGGDAE